jgi:YfiH family protein
MTQPIRAHTLARLPGIRHAFFTRAGGVSKGVYASLNAGIGSSDEPRNVAENRARMAATLRVPPERFLTCYQIHSPAVVVAVEPWQANARPRADAIVTRVAALAIGVSTADCGPVLLADAQARVIAAAHAGWRGALAGVTDETIAAMERLGAARERMVATLGPMIRQPSYETGTDVWDRFVAAAPANARFFRPAAREKHFMFDLAGYVVARLAAAGIGTIEDIGACTYADADKFFSYRRMTHRGEADYGRHINAIVLEESIS